MVGGKRLVMRIRFLLLGLLILVMQPGLAHAQDYVTESLRISMPAAGPQGLEALLVRPAGSGRFPLALLNHGSPRNAVDRAGMTPQQMLPQLMEFARRGFAAATVMRRGYGTSGGGWAETYGSCSSPDYVAAGRAAAADLKATIAALSKREDIDPDHMLSIGVSAGGFATVALTEDPPPGLVAAISFAGARGSTSADTVCKPSALIDAFHTFGSHSRVPMLWVFAENDHFFGPRLADQLQHAFTEGGGKVDFKHIAAFGTDGHGVFSAAGRPVWTPLVDVFLKQQMLQNGDRIRPLPALARLRPPAQLSASGRGNFQTYLAAAPHKAFAVSAKGAYGWRTAQRSERDARDGAMKLCAQSSTGPCRIYAIDDAYAAPN
jgi:dienelactone hydrolase